VRRTSALEVRTTIFSLVLLVVAVAGVGTWQIVDSRSSRSSQMLADEASSSRFVAAGVASSITDQLDFTGNLVGEFGLARLFQHDDRSELERLVLALHLLRPTFASVGALNASGRVLARWPTTPQGDRTGAVASFFGPVARSGKAYVAPVVEQQLAPREPVIPLATPVHAGGQLVGVFYVTLRATDLASSVGGTSFGTGGRIVIIDQSGHVVGRAPAGTPGSVASLPFVAAALRGGSGSGTGTAPGIEGVALVGYAAVPSIGWAVLVEQPGSAIEGPVGALTARLVVLEVLVLLVALGAGAVVLRLVRRLQRDQEHAGALLRSMGEGVATVGPTGLLQDMNPALESLTGRRAREHVGRPWSDALPLHDARGRPIGWDDSVLGEAARERHVAASSGYDLYLARADGRRVPVAITASPVLASEQVEGSVVVVRDVSREREVDQLKSSLVSTVSHELRTPLTMIQGFSELMLAPGRFDEAQRQEALDQIHTSARRLGRLIDDLLSVARIESGRLSADLEPVDVGPLVADAVAGFPSAARDRVAVDVDPAMPAVLADRDKTLQVMTNLVSNALKYSSAGTPVRVAVRRVDDHAEVSIADDGIGMSEDDLRTIFEKFTRVDHPQVRRAGGTGLGLYITKSLVELQRGQLWVESSEGRGSRFTFSLPLAPAEPDGHRPPGRAEPARSAQWTGNDEAS
jgi:PAS domain S-box-containing protein